MKIKIFTLVTALFITALSVSTTTAAQSADKYICSLDNQQRVIEVVYSHPTDVVPCAVKYHKADTTDILWRAENQAGYCEMKADEFATKQQTWGWQCEHLTDTPKALDVTTPEVTISETE